MATPEEEENFIRIFKLVSGVAPKAVKCIFDKCFLPLSLTTILKQQEPKLKALHLKKRLTTGQMALLFPASGVTSSSSYDVTLMICLLRNLTTIPPPVNGFDVLPPSSEIHDGADLARVKYYRNRAAHSELDRLPSHEFTTIWNDLEQALVRLGGWNFKSMCDDIKQAFLSHDIYLDVRQEMSLFHEQIRVEYQEIKVQHEQFKLELEQIKSGLLNDRSHTQTSSENISNPELMQVSSIDGNSYPMAPNHSSNPVAINANSISSTSNSASASLSSIFSGTFINSSISVQNLHVHYGNNNVSQQMPEN